MDARLSGSVFQSSQIGDQIINRIEPDGNPYLSVMPSIGSWMGRVAEGEMMTPRQEGLNKAHFQPQTTPVGARMVVAKPKSIQKGEIGWWTGSGEKKKSDRLFYRQDKRRPDMETTAIFPGLENADLKSTGLKVDAIRNITFGVPVATEIVDVKPVSELTNP